MRRACTRRPGSRERRRCWPRASRAVTVQMKAPESVSEQWRRQRERMSRHKPAPSAGVRTGKVHARSRALPQIYGMTSGNCFHLAPSLQNWVKRSPLPSLFFRRQKGWSTGCRPGPCRAGAEAELLQVPFDLIATRLGHPNTPHPLTPQLWERPEKNPVSSKRG